MLRRSVTQIFRLNLLNQHRAFSKVTDNLSNLFATEIRLENKATTPISVQEFLKNNKSWKFSFTDGQVVLKLEKTVEDFYVEVDWQCAPFFADSGAVSTDFRVTVQRGEVGVIFYCRTYSGDDSEDQSSRFAIDTVRTYENDLTKNSPHSYSGPTFGDMSDELQNSLDGFLESLGVDDSICDFIDGASMHKEQKEYVRWLGSVKEFLEKKDIVY